MAKPVLVCPTHGRAGRLTTHEVINDLMLCVSESQEPLYKEHYPDIEYVVHPDDVLGLARKRDWIYKKFGNVFMVDDDIIGVLDLTSAKGKVDRIKPAQVPGHIYRLHEMAEDIGAYLYGYAPIADVRTYKALNPFRFKGYVPGHSFGMVKGGNLWWHPDCIQEDYWICLLNAHFHRMIVRDDRIGFVQKDTFKGVGGLGAHRTIGREGEGFRILKEHFGEVVQKRTVKYGQTNGVLTERHASHPWQPTMKLPF